jgi:hypothetical protein
MQKLIMIWLVAAVGFALSTPYTTSAANPTDEDGIGAQAKIAQLQAILDEENEGLQDDEDLEEDQEDPESQGDIEDDFGDEEDQEDSSDEWGAPT